MTMSSSETYRQVTGKLKKGECADEGNRQYR